MITRLNTDEHQQLQKRVKKSGMSQEAYVRQIINGLAPTDAPPPDYYCMMRELHAIGTSLNQIAQKAHVLNAIDVEQYDENAAALHKAVVDITNAVMLPRKLEGPPQSKKALRGEEQPRSDEPFDACDKSDKRRVL